VGPDANRAAGFTRLPLSSAVAVSTAAAAAALTLVFGFQAAFFAAAMLALAAPVLLVALSHAPSQNRTRLGTFALLFFLDISLNMAPCGPWLAGTQWNWQGKALEALWPVLFIAWAGSGFGRFGVRARIEAGSERAVVTAGAAALAFALLKAVLSPVPLPTAESVWFQLTMPGLGEELAFRGVFQSLLNEVFPERWQLWGAKVGWGWVLTAVLFGLCHILAPSGFGVRVSLLKGVFPLVFGLFVGWVRERSGSVWPGVAFHNVINAVPRLAKLAAHWV
jgi:membrane protease YdiL (CAAX protease family)